MVNRAAVGQSRMPKRGRNPRDGTRNGYFPHGDQRAVALDRHQCKNKPTTLLVFFCERAARAVRRSP